MLKEKMIDRLNEQINLEFYSSNLYLQMSSWCEFNGFEGSAKFLRNHAEEEMMHMEKIFSYINETGAMAKLGAIDAPPTEFNSFTELFEEIYEHEKFITQKINELVALAFELKDFSTFNFLQWYVSEQHEEENLFGSIVDKIKLLGDDKKNLFFIDRDIKDLISKLED